VTQAIYIPPAPALVPAPSYLQPETVATYSDIEELPYPLQAMETVMVFIDFNGNIFHLNGPQAGKEGVVFYENLQGEHHLFFEQVTVEGAYMLGGIIDRVNYAIRKINFRVYIGSPGMNNITYRMCEDRWWAGQDEVNGGWFGVFTRLTGWRWIQVYPAKTVDTTQKRDPVAYDNNCAVWDIDWIAVIPYYAKPSINSAAWVAANSGPANAQGYYTGTIGIPNHGDMASSVKYLVTGDNAGSCIVQDNNSTNFVTLPELYDTDGDVLCDTDPIHKTLVAQNDPQPDAYYAISSASGLLNFFLQSVSTPAHEALWLRGYVRFIYVVPPYSVVHLKVQHTNPGAVIIAQLPQRFKRSR
jgi:hypothetical protein